MSKLGRKYPKEIDFDQLPIYARPWWWDMACGKDHWSLIESQSPIKGYKIWVPRLNRTIKGINAWVQPVFTQYTPVIALDVSNGKIQLVGPQTDDSNILEALLVFFKTDTTPIVELNLDLSDAFRAALNKQIFSVDARTSYRLRASKPDDTHVYSTNLKRNIKKAKKAFFLRPARDIEKVFDLIKSSMERNNGVMVASKDKVEALIAALRYRECGECWMAVDHAENTVGTVIVGWDSEKMYYFMGGQKVQKGQPSAHSLLLDKAIRLANNAELEFDFCGSVLPGIARFFASFGAKKEAFATYNKYQGLGKIKELKKRIVG